MLKRSTFLIGLPTAVITTITGHETPHDDRPTVYGVAFDRPWRCGDCGTNHGGLVTAHGGTPIAYANREEADKWRGFGGGGPVAIRTDERYAAGVKGCEHPEPTPTCRYPELHVKRLAA